MALEIPTPIFSGSSHCRDNSSDNNNDGGLEQTTAFYAMRQAPRMVWKMKVHRKGKPEQRWSLFLRFQFPTPPTYPPHHMLGMLLPHQDPLRFPNFPPLPSSSLSRPSDRVKLFEVRRSETWWNVWHKRQFTVCRLLAKAASSRISLENSPSPSRSTQFAHKFSRQRIT